MKQFRCLLWLLALTALLPVSALAAEPASPSALRETAAVFAGYEQAVSATRFLASGTSGLSQEEQMLAYVAQQLLQRKTKIAISSYGIPSDFDFEKIFCLPEAFACTNLTYYVDTATHSRITSLCPDYSISEEDYPAAVALYQSNVQRIVALCDPGWSDPEKILFVHDHLAAYYEYDPRSFQPGFDRSQLNYDAYTFFRDGYGVCQAYTAAFLAVMRDLDIPASYVQSNKLDHIWNLVQLDGEWYHLDVTWDDPTKDQIGRVVHTYFLCSDAEFRLNGHPDSDWRRGVSAVCDDASYQGSWIRTVNSPVLHVGSSLCYLSGNRICRRSGDEEALLSYGTGGLSCYLGKLYYIQNTQLRAYDLHSGEDMLVYSADDQSIIGSRLLSDGVLQYQLDDRSIETLVIDPYLPADAGVSWYYWEGVFHIRTERNPAVLCRYVNGRQIAAILCEQTAELAADSGQVVFFVFDPVTFAPLSAPKLLTA